MSPVPHEPTAGRGTVDIGLLRWWQLPDVARLEREVFAEDAWSEELFWSELAQGPLRYYLVALDRRGVVGYAGLAAYGEDGYIQTLAVAPAGRCAGVGTRLVVALLREAHRRRATTCGLEVRTDNAAAQSLYERLGFRRVGVRRGYYQPSGADAYVMIAQAIDAPAYAGLLDRVEGLVRR